MNPVAVDLLGVGGVCVEASEVLEGEVVGAVLIRAHHTAHSTKMFLALLVLIVNNIVARMGMTITKCKIRVTALLCMEGPPDLSSNRFLQHPDLCPKGEEALRTQGKHMDVAEVLLLIFLHHLQVTDQV